MGSIALAIVCLGVLVLLHEAGHFLLARACRMRVDVFSLGFGPALLTLRGRLTEYRIGLFPLGGYVRIAGMAPGDFPPDDPASFHARPWWQRLLVLLAGPVSNWLFALLLLAGLYSIGGYRVPTGEPVIEEVPGYRAAVAVADLRPGDRVLAVGGEKVESWSALIERLGAQQGEFQLLIRRNDRELTLKARSGADVARGIRPETREVHHPVGEALYLALRKTVELAASTLGLLGDYLRGEGEAELLGPPGVIAETVQAARTGFDTLFATMVMISIGLALLNMLPLPALDGGRIVFVLIGAIRRRSIDLRVEALVHGFGVLALLTLIVWLSWKDIGRYFTGSGGAGDDAGYGELAEGAPSQPDASIPSPPAAPQ